MIKVLFDTNVLLDIALDREPFAEHSIKAFQLKSSGKIQIYVNVLTVINTHYFIRKEKDKIKAKEFVVELLKLVDLAEINEQIIVKAFKSEFPDFEDAVQEYSAIQSELEVILTRNTKDFKHSQLKVLTPMEFIHWFEKTT